MSETPSDAVQGREPAERRVLLVDDEERILKSLKRLLHSEKMTVSAANSPEAALEAVAKERYAVVVSDQNMPTMTGTELLAKVRDIAPDTVRIILTGNADIDAAMEAINRGAVYRFLTKPWDDEELRTVIRQGVAQYDLVEENRRLQALTSLQNEELREFNQNLEKKVEQRTQEITDLNSQLHKSFLGSIRILADLAEMHSSLIGSHHRRTASLCMNIAHQMEISERDTFQIVVAATLHDIGKIGISAAVLEKAPHEMTRDDHVQLESHSERGERVAQMVPNLRDVPLLIRHHHEQYDGAGYPDRLKGKRIPLGSRIIAAADAYDHRLNSRRTYASATPEKALEMIRKGGETLFDPEVVAAMAACLEKSTCFGTEGAEVDVRPEDVEDGMVLSRELRTLRGVLLLPAETVIRKEHLGRIHQRYGTDPAAGPIYVYRNAAETADTAPSDAAT